MWNDRDPGSAVQGDDVVWGDVEEFGQGIVTRGVLLDIPRLRGSDFVTQDDPVQGHELEAASKTQGSALSPGDALAVYSGRESWELAHGPWGAKTLMEGQDAQSNSSLIDLAWKDHACR
jgi:hypothetical protein